MANRYGLLRQSNSGITISFTIVDMTVYPLDTKSYLRGDPEWYRQEMISSFYIVIFPVSVRQTETESRKRADEYLDFMNRQDDAIQMAIKLVTI